MFKQVNRRLVAGLMAMAVVISNVIAPVSPAFAHGSETGPGDETGTDSKVTICHATNSQTNPYVTDTVDASSIDASNNQYLNGHGDHTGPVWHQGIADHSWGDIIPPFTNNAGHSFPGRNWTTEGQSIYNNGCKVPKVITALPQSTITGACGLDNDIIFAGAATSQYSAGVAGAFVNGVATVTYTAKAGFVFANNSSTYVETVHELNRAACVVAITVLPKSTVTGICGLNNDTITVGEETNQYSAGVASAFVNGVATVTYTAKPGFVFANNSPSYTETVYESNTNPVCIPTKPDDYTTTTTKTTTICLPGGGGKTTTWTTVNTYTHILIYNKWVSILKSSKTTDQTVDASEADCPVPKQVNPTCDTFGSLTLPAYKDGIPGVKHTYYVWVNGVKTSYSASSDVVVANIPQGAIVEVKLYINGTERFGLPIYKHTFTFTTSDCIAVPQAPQQIDECGLNNAYWVVPADTTEIHWFINAKGELIAKAIGGKFTNHHRYINFGTAEDSGALCPPTRVVPVQPQIVDCEAILPITAHITYKHVYLDANGNIVDPSQAGITATQQGVVATADAGYLLDPSNDGGKRLDNGSYLYILDFTGMSCGKGDVTPPTVTPPAKTASAALPSPAELPHTGSSLSGLLVTLLATLSTYGVVYFLQPKRR